jgi:hypothetical protein
MKFITILLISLTFCLATQAAEDNRLSSGASGAVTDGGSCSVPSTSQPAVALAASTQAPPDDGTPSKQPDTKPGSKTGTNTK